MSIRYSMSRQIDIGNDLLQSRQEVAHLVGCCTRTVVRAEKRGELKAVRLSSRMTRYRASDIERWIKNATKEPSKHGAGLSRA